MLEQGATLKVTGGRMFEPPPQGPGVANDAGKELSSFLTLKEATVCSTWFLKKTSYKQTWQHSESEKWNCTDFAITRQKEVP